MISLGLLGMGGRPAWRPKDSWCDGRKGGQHGGQRIAGVTEGKGANMFTDKFLILPFSGVLGAVLNAKVNFVEDMDEILNEALIPINICTQQKRGTWRGNFVEFIVYALQESTYLYYKL
jgi:hypothetical protein